MKVFILKVILFFTIILGLDRIAGCVFSYMSSHSRGGYTSHFQHIVNHTNEDILIFGSSRAVHHYNTSIMSDSFDLSCYNCGLDGNGIILFNGWWRIISQRYNPKYLIYDITPSYDLLKGEDNCKYLGYLKELYNRNEIKSIFSSVDSNESYKMMSQMYRYNSKWHQIVADYIYPLYHFDNHGFLPLYGQINKMMIDDDKINAVNIFEYDDLKISYLEELIANRGKTQLIFVMSPSWYGIDENELQPIYDLCESNDIPFFNFGNDRNYMQNERYFKDGLHMNVYGAEIFTKDLVAKIKLSGII